MSDAKETGELIADVRRTLMEVFNDLQKCKRALIEHRIRDAELQEQILGLKESMIALDYKSEASQI